MMFGRMRGCDVTCLSLLVSREHCQFMQVPEGLHVIDLGVNYFYLIKIVQNLSINLKEMVIYM